MNNFFTTESDVQQRASLGIRLINEILLSPKFFGEMLIKSDDLGALLDGVETPADSGNNKLHERLKQDQEKGNPTKLKHFPTKYYSFVSERKFDRSSLPLDITEIRPYLFLCGAFALRGNALEDLGVTCVINATKELPDTPLPSSLKDSVLYLRVNVDDKSDSDILSWLDLVTDITHQVKLAGGKTLIHCVAGISRSATLCLAYLIKFEGFSLLESYLMLKAVREVIRPNSGFFGQLIEFEKRITGKQTVLMVHSDYANSYIPQMYEEDYHRLHLLKCQRS